MVRLLIFLLGMLTTSRTGHPDAAWYRDYAPGAEPDSPLPGSGGQRPPLPGHAVPPPGQATPPPGQRSPWQPETPGQTAPLRTWQPPPTGPRRKVTRRWGQPTPSRRRRIPRWLGWGASVLALGLIFRKAIAFLVVTALAAALHLVGLDVHLPTVKFGWPWQSVTAGTTTNTQLGPWVLQKIEGISRPALGVANFSFYFTHKVSKSIGPWPCWYASTFYAVGRASATVDLNPGPTWWKPSTGHYRLQVLSRPFQGRPGHVAVTMVLPQPQLPRSVNDVTVNDIPSKPISSQHSWTYPGFGCGVVLRPQFPESVLYAQAQRIAYYKSAHAPQVTRPLVRTAQTQATRTIRDNFIQPTLNAFGYDLDRFTLRWAAGP